MMLVKPNVLQYDMVSDAQAIITTVQLNHASDSEE